jgi:hypothetical protein
MRSSGTIYIPKFHTDWFRHSKSVAVGGKYIQKYRQQGDLISLLYFFLNKESSLKIGIRSVWRTATMYESLRLICYKEIKNIISPDLFPTCIQHVLV